MSSADLVAVPLKSMCSTKWAMPLCSAASCREPRVNQTPMLIDRTCVICSLRTRRPLSRMSLTMGEFDKLTLAAEGEARSRNARFHNVGRALRGASLKAAKH